MRLETINDIFGTFLAKEIGLKHITFTEITPDIFVFGVNSMRFMIKHPELVCYHMTAQDSNQDSFGLAKIDDYSILITNKLKKFIQNEVYKINNDIENEGE